MAFSCFFSIEIGGTEDKCLWTVESPSGIEWYIQQEWVRTDSPFARDVQEITLQSSEMFGFIVQLEIFHFQRWHALQRIRKLQPLSVSRVFTIRWAEYEEAFFSSAEFDTKFTFVLKFFPNAIPHSIHDSIAAKAIESNEKCIKYNSEQRLDQLSKDMQILLENCVLSDLVLVSGSVEIKVHKNILSARSPVFARMFDVPMRENLENRVTISDVDCAVLQEMISYIYTGKITFENASMIRALYIAADKYDIQHLKSLCYSSLRNLNLDTVVDTLILADLYKDNELKKVAMNFITENYSQLKGTENWDLFVKENLSLSVEVLTYVIDHKQ